MSAGNQATPQAAFGFTRHGNEKSESAKRGICVSKLLFEFELRSNSRREKSEICEARDLRQHTTGKASGGFLSLNCEAIRGEKKVRFAKRGICVSTPQAKPVGKKTK